MKYELTDETYDYNGHTLHRIRRCNGGELGGWVESEDNLSQVADCWVADEAKVWGNAWIHDDAQIYNKAVVGYDAEVYGNARVLGNAHVCDDTEVYGNTYVC